MTVRYEVAAGKATITIDDPGRRNPMSVETMSGLLGATRPAVDESEVDVIVYTGVGDRAFSAGGVWSGMGPCGRGGRAGGRRGEGGGEARITRDERGRRKPM